MYFYVYVYIYIYMNIWKYIYIYIYEYCVCTHTSLCILFLYFLMNLSFFSVRNCQTGFITFCRRELSRDFEPELFFSCTQALRINTSFSLQLFIQNCYFCLKCEVDHLGYFCWWKIVGTKSVRNCQTGFNIFLGREHVRKKNCKCILRLLRQLNLGQGARDPPKKNSNIICFDHWNMR